MLAFRHNPKGYREKLVGKKYFPEHRIVMEEYLKRKLKPTEFIHHKNGIRDDNRLVNLQVVTYEEHMKLHGKMLYAQQIHIIDFSNPTKPITEKELMDSLDVKYHDFRKWIRNGLPRFNNPTWVYKKLDVVKWLVKNYNYKLAIKTSNGLKLFKNTGSY